MPDTICFAKVTEIRNSYTNELLIPYYATKYSEISFKTPFPPKQASTRNKS